MSLEETLQFTLSRRLPFAMWCLILCNGLFLITSIYMVLIFQSLVVLVSAGYQGQLNQEPVNQYSPRVTFNPIKASLQTVALLPCAIIILQLVANGTVAYVALVPPLRSTDERPMVLSEQTPGDSKHLSEAVNIKTDVPETRIEESQPDCEDIENTGPTTTTKSETQSAGPPIDITHSPSVSDSDTRRESSTLPNEPQLPDLYAELKKTVPPVHVMRLASIIFALREDTIPVHMLYANKTMLKSFFATGILHVTHVWTAWGFLFHSKFFREDVISRAVWYCGPHIIRYIGRFSPLAECEANEVLWGAVAHDDEELVVWSLRQTSCSWDLAYTPLHLAAQRGKTKIMRLLVEGVATKRSDLATILDSLLVIAIDHRSLEVADMLIDWGADRRSISLGAAVVAGHEGIVEERLKEGLIANNTLCGPMLQTACVHGHTKVVRLLLDYGHDINQVSSRALGGNTPLMGAVSGNHPSLVEFLICQGASFDGRGEFGNALQTAAFWNYIDVARVLLEHGFNVDAADVSLPTPQAMALRRGHWDMVKLLKQAGASKEALDNYDRLYL